MGGVRRRGGGEGAVNDWVQEKDKWKRMMSSTRKRRITGQRSRSSWRTESTRTRAEGRRGERSEVGQEGQ